MRFIDRYHRTLQDHIKQLNAATERLEKLEETVFQQRSKFAHERLGDSARREFIAAADPSVSAASIATDELKSHVARLYEGATVLYRTKRNAIVSVGAVFCICNRFGVSTFTLPFTESHPLCGWGSQHSTPDFGFSGSLPEAIGVARDGADRGDPIYRYDSPSEQKAA
jgi:hypothetical protein